MANLLPPPADLSPQTLEGLRRYWEGIKGLFSEEHYALNAMVRLDERTFMWCVAQPLSADTIRHLQDSWNALVPDIRMIIISQTSFILSFEQVAAFAADQIIAQTPDTTAVEEIAAIEGTTVAEMVASVRKPRAKKAAEAAPES